MNEKLKEIFIRQMLLPKEELAMQTMELMADKMDLQSKIDKAIECLVNNIDLEMDDFTKIDLGCDVLKILDLDKYNEFLKENNNDKC